MPAQKLSNRIQQFSDKFPVKDNWTTTYTSFPLYSHCPSIPQNLKFASL